MDLNLDWENLKKEIAKEHGILLEKTDLIAILYKMIVFVQDDYVKKQEELLEMFSNDVVASIRAFEELKKVHLSTLDAEFNKAHSNIAILIKDSEASVNSILKDINTTVFPKKHTSTTENENIIDEIDKKIDNHSTNLIFNIRCLLFFSIGINVLFFLVLFFLV